MLQQDHKIIGIEEICRRLQLPWPVIRLLAEHENLPLKEEAGQFVVISADLAEWEARRQ